jgi:hypothetical protein
MANAFARILFGLLFIFQGLQLLINKVLGKKIGCTLLRSIFLTSKYGKIMEEMKEDTDAMATSIDVARSNYIKH